MPEYPSTLLVNLSDKLDKISDETVRRDIETEIRKADLDLLSKINELAGGSGALPAVTNTAAHFAAFNPVIALGQLAYETDTKLFKIGDGSTAYNTLPYQPYPTKAPLPQAAVGVGQEQAFVGGSGAAVSLPAGGTWFYWILSINNGTGGINIAQSGGGFAAGGTSIYAGFVGFNSFGVWYRIT